MDVDAVLAELEGVGTEQNRTVYARHGAGNKQFGVSFKDLRAMGKRLRYDDTLARALWKSGYAEARILATMVADPDTITERTVDSWVKDIRYYVLADEFAGQLVSKTPYAQKKMEEWTLDEREFVGQVGWDLVAHLAMQDVELPDGYFESYLERVENDIHGSKNRVKHSMNGALIAVGRRDPVLRDVALDVASRIGKVEVDHGETGCKTPDAAGYIKKKAPERAKKRPAK